MFKSLLKLFIAGIAINSMYLHSQEFEFDYEPPIPDADNSDNDDLQLEFYDLAFSLKASDETKVFGMWAHSSDFETDLVLMDTTFAFKPHWNLGGTYIYLGSDGNTDQHTWRSHLDFTFKTSSISWVVRNSWDHRFSTGDVSTRNRFRSRIRAEYGHVILGRKFFVYGYVEPIYNITDESLTNIYYSIGSYFELTPQIYVNALYFHAENRQNVDAGLTSIGLVFMF